MAFDDSYGVQLATKLEMQLRQPRSDLSTKLVNNDYEGEFFRIGDTVQIVKPDMDSVTVTDGAKSKARPSATELDFSNRTLQIDRSMAYAFFISDINVAENSKWNYESLGLDQVAQKMRTTHNLRLANLIANDTTITRIGTPAAPIVCADGDEFFKKVLTKCYATLYNQGAIDGNAHYTYGSNPTEQHRTRASLFMPMDGYVELLTSKYFTDRSTEKADEKVETADIGRVLGMEIGIEPALSSDAAIEEKITVASLASGAFVVIAGTANCVTRASKVLKPEVLRDQEDFQDNYYGLEIYGEKVFQPKTAVVAFVKIGAGA